MFKSQIFFLSCALSLLGRLIYCAF